VARRKRQMNTVRTDYLEGKIAFYEATGRADVAQVLRTLARDCSVPLSEAEIDKQRAIVSNVYGIGGHS
jgi:hypothetical protein